MRLLVRSKSLFALTVSVFLLLLFLLALPALAANNSPSGIIVTDDKDFPPFAFLDATGNPRGITIDIWALWSKKTGIPVKFDLVKWDDALKAVREGRADAVGGLFLTPERKAYFDYTKEIIRIPTAIFFHHQIAGIKGLADLSGFQVGVIRGDSSEELLRTEHPEINLLIYASTDELVRAAIAGRIRVFVADEPIALFYLAKYPGGEAFRWSSKEIAINRQYSAVRKGNHQLLTTVQSGFDQISQEEINDIVTEWSGKSSRVAVPWREIGLILFVILFIVTAVFIWNIQLRRRVLRATRNLEERNRELELSREAIRHSEERYRELMEHANSVILRMDKEGQILFLNEFALRFFGFRKEEVIGRNVIGTIVPEQETTGRDLTAMIKDIAVNPSIYANNENENMRSNGERVWVAWTNKPVYNPDGEVSEILCIGNDITDRKRSEEALRQSEERFSKAFRSSPAPLTITEIDTGCFIDVNEAWIKMLGYTREEQIGQTSKEVGIWLDPSARDHTVHKLRSQGFCKEEPVTFIAKNGGHVQALWSAEIIELGPQKVMLSMLYDETERKQTEDALRQSEERFAKAFRSSPAPLVISDIDTGRFIDVNDAWVKLLGYAREEQIGRTSKEIGIWVNPNERDYIVRKINYQGFFKEEPINFKTKTGRHVRALWSAETIALGGHKVMLSMIYDETDRIEALEALQKSEARLSSVIEGTNVGTWEWNVQTGETVFNERWAEMVGYRLADLTPVSIKTWQALAHPDDLEASDSQLKELFEHRRSYYDIECRMKHRNGDWVWVHDRGKVISWTADGKPELMAGTHTDITERKQVEQQIIEYNQMLHSILAASPVGIGKIRNRTVSWVNDTLCRLSGYSKQEIEGQDASIFYESPEEYERIGNLIYEEGQVETRLATKDGFMRDVLIQIAPTDSYSYIFSIVDITQQKKDEEDLKFFKYVLDTARDSLFMVSIDAKLLYVNESACNSLGYTKDELLKMYVWDNEPVYPKEKWADFLTELRQAGSLIFESVHKKKNGTSFPVEISANLHRYHGEEYIFAFIRDITVRKQMTEELVKVQGLLNTAFMQSPSGILIADAPDVRIKMANPAALGIRGAENSHLVDINVALHTARWQTFYPDGRSVLPEELPLSRAVLKGETCRNVEVIIRNEQGEDRWVSANASPVRDKDGRIIAGMVIFHDITEAKRMETALRQSEEKFKVIFEESPFSIILNDLHTGQFTDVNRAYADMYQSHLEKDFIVGKTALDLGILLDADDDKRVNEKLANTGRVDFEEVRLVDAQGKSRVIMLSSRIIDIGGKKQVLTTLQDITERINMEEALRESENRFRAILDQSPFATMVFTPDGKIMWINDAHCKLWGISREMPQWQNYNVFDDPQLEKLGLSPMFQRAFAGERLSVPPLEYDLSAKFGKGLSKIVKGDFYPVHNADGMLASVILVHEDVTERERNEKAINQLQEQLRQAQKMEAIGTLAGGIAHDFNNILGSIMGYSELAKMNASDAEMERYLDQVLKASDRAKALVAQILTFSRQNSQEKKPLTVTPIFKEVLKLLRSSLPSNIQIRQNLSCPNDTVYADPTQVYQVLMNLCTNAAHAMREEGGILEITLDPEQIPNPHMHYEYNLQEGTYLKLTVRDNGCGMEPSVVEHIFEPFFTTKKEGEGTGLGLSVVYGIVKNHGGSIHVSSAPDKGTTFTVLLPLIEEETMLREEAASPIPRGTGHILLVDDEEALAKMGGKCSPPWVMKSACATAVSMPWKSFAKNRRNMIWSSRT